MSFTVAIDGPAAAGKGTISKRVAQEFGFAHLDTGLLYRAVARRALDGQDAIQAAQSLTSEDTQRDDLRTPEVAQMASQVAAMPQIRAALVDFQRAFAARAGGAVLDGRDIGTVICPHAEVKIFVTASAQIRAKRRWQEMAERGIEIPLERVLADVMARDNRDRERAEAPMKQADDALVIDTSDMSIEDAVGAALAIIRLKMPR